MDEAFTVDRFSMEYHVEPGGTGGELFQLQVRDASGTLPWTTIESLAASPAPLTIDKPVAEYTDVPSWVWQHPVFRIVDSIHTDNWVGADQDTLRILSMWLHAELAVE